MSRIRGKDTGPERIVRKALFTKGLRFRLHVKNLPGKPDIVLPKYHAVVLVDGCFWHGHKRCKVFKMPRSRVSFWTKKIEANRMRDSRNRQKLRRMGWRVIRVWECQLRARKHEQTIQRILTGLQEGF